MKKNNWYDSLWIWTIVYFALGFFNILFAWLGMIDFLVPLFVAIIGGNKAFCNHYCGRGQLLSKCGKCSRNVKAPKWLSSKWFRYGFLIFFLSMFGNMIPAMLAPIILNMYKTQDSTPYAITAVICAGIGFVICLLHYFMTEERTTVGENVKADDIKFSDILDVVKKNRPFVALCIHGICICTMQYVAQTLSIYMYSSVFHNTAYQSIGTALSSPIMIGSMIAVPFMCKKLGLMKVIRYSLLIGGGIYAILFGMHMVMDVHPLIHSVISGLGMGMGMVSIQMQWGLVGEAIDYNELVTGKRTEGSIYGTFNLSRRIGQTIGQGFAIYALGWIGYNGTVEFQTASTIVGLKVLCVLVPAVFVLGSWAAFKFVWNITPEKKAEMIAMKEAQKAEASAETDAE